MANKKQYSYYIGVIMGDGSLRFVTEIAYPNKYAKWESGKDAKEFSMSEADNIVYGLLLNFYYAFTVKVPNGVKFHNPEVEEKGVE